MGEASTATIATAQKKNSSNHLSVHQWIRSATHASQQLSSPIVSYLRNFHHRLVRYYWYEERIYSIIDIIKGSSAAAKLPSYGQVSMVSPFIMSTKEAVIADDRRIVAVRERVNSRVKTLSGAKPCVSCARKVCVSAVGASIGQRCR